MKSSTTQTFSAKRWRKLSRKWWVIILFAMIITAIVIGYFFTRQNQLSKEDFVAIEQKMDSIYANMNLEDVDKAKICYYYEDGMGRVLKCGIEMAGYIPIKSPNDLVALREKFGEELRLISSTNDIWRTNLGSDDLTQNASFSVKDNHVNMGCLASISTKDNVLLGRGLPERDLADKAVLVLTCGGGSREPYFDIRPNQYKGGRL